MSPTYVPKTLATVIAEKAGVDVDIAATVMEAMCLHIIESVMQDKEVAFTNFIKFKRSTRKARTFMPPKATQAVEIGERFAMTVKVMPKMKLILNPEDEALISKAAKKPIPKKKEEKSDEEKPPKKAVKAVKAVPKKKPVPVPVPVAVDSDSDSEDEEDEEVPAAVSDSDSDEEEEAVAPAAISDSDSDEEAVAPVAVSDSDSEDSDSDVEVEEVVEVKEAFTRGAKGTNKMAKKAPKKV